MIWFLLLLLVANDLAAQTDAGIFREFQFDFSTPGARANAMGRAFVGLADEATAAYGNPAGLSVLASPEISLEGRGTTTLFPALVPADGFTFPQTDPIDDETSLSRVGFGSYSFSSDEINYSLFFVNNLDYQRALTEQTTIFDRDDISPTTLIEQHHVRGIQLSTYGLSLSRNFGNLSLGFGAGIAQLDLDYRYNFSATNAAFANKINGEAKGSSQKMAWIFGAIYQVGPSLRLGFSHKRQPLFSYKELFQTPLTQNSEVQTASVHFKIPDSTQLGISFQPNDRWTLLVDLDWTRYSQQVGANMSLLSPNRITRMGLRYFDRSSYFIKDDLNYRLGGEFLVPINRNILALRAGTFLDSDHRTRFVNDPPEGNTPSQTAILAAVYDTYSFIYNTGSQKSDLGYTGGIGLVLHNKVQLDAAIVRSDNFNRAVVSMLYRF